MSAERAYIIEVLKTVKSKCVRPTQHDVAVQLDHLMERVVRSDDLKKDIDALYFVPGYEDFALRLLWIFERMRVDGGAPNHAVTAFAVEQLVVAIPKSASRREG